MAAAATMLLAASCSQYKYETVANDPLETKIYTLDNGLKVYMSVNKEAPRIQTGIAVRVGGKNDPSETTGLAHYFEHLMFKGTENFGTSDYAAEKPMLDEIEALFEVYRKTEDNEKRAEIYHRIDSISYEASKLAIPNEYDKLMSVIGANGTNAFTSSDMTVYVEDIPSNQIENWARIEADRFKNPVIRGFHTELETIYEEKNMSLTQDSRKIWEALDAALFPNHPYGTQTVLGTQEHLKNPSITNVKNYHRTWYVPNNMAICLSGDFDPDKMVAVIEKYFGDMQPNDNLPVLEFEEEKPIEAPIVREVFGPEAENIMIGWRLPKACDESSDIAEIAGMVLYNGQAGILDLDVNQQQKALSAYGYSSLLPDYGQFLVGGMPKQGQSLDELRELLLAEVAKLRSGDFDEALVQSTINNYNLGIQKMLEDNQDRAMMYVQSFINGADWKDQIRSIDRIAKITKADIVEWANRYLGPESYAVVYKKTGTDASEQKIAAPKITPIVMNRDIQSAFLTEIQNSEVTPIEPVFVDYSKDMSVFAACEGIDVLYKKNTVNDIASVSYLFETGTENDPALNLAFNYISYLGTPTMSAEEIASKMYSLACSFSTGSGANTSRVSVNGLSENIPEAIDIVEDLIANAVPDENILANLKADMLKSRADSKLRQRSCFSALQRYIIYGPDFIKRTTLPDSRLKSITSEELLSKVRSLMGKQHEVLYYGPEKEAAVAEILAGHHCREGLENLARTRTPARSTDKPAVYIAPYDAKQLYYIQYSNRGEKFDLSADAEIELYNGYFGGGMNAIVFQEMREARGLAYTAYTTLSSPGFKDDTYYYLAFIATQNDKMKQAIEAFDDIINNMPESENAFDIAKESLISRLRTERTTGYDVLWSYLDNRDLGLEESRDRAIFEKLQDMTLEDVKAAQEKWVKGRQYIYGILGDEKDIDMAYLRTLGPVNRLTLEDIFGY